MMHQDIVHPLLLTNASKYLEKSRKAEEGQRILVVMVTVRRVITTKTMGVMKTRAHVTK